MELDLYDIPVSDNANRFYKTIEEVMMQWQVYLSGEIHSDWREKITDGVQREGLIIGDRVTINCWFFSINVTLTPVVLYITT